MRALDAPTQDPCIVFQTCVNSISDVNLQMRLTALSNDIHVAANDYQQKAIAKQLFSLQQNNCGNNDIALGNVTKKELKSLYSAHMVNRSKPSRQIYDLLLSRAPLGRCPFCGMGHASTLDHYLPKTKYPQLSVLPINLVPSCKDCNTRKSAAVAIVEEAQALHPYFDHEIFINEQWLYAEVIESIPATINFCVQAPPRWDDISKARVKSHFNDFKLACRYSIEASSQIACLRYTLLTYREILGSQGIKQHLMNEAQANYRVHPNSWQTAMYQALADSNWYCDSGFM